MFRATVKTAIVITSNHTAMVGGLRNHLITDDLTNVLAEKAMNNTAEIMTTDVTSRL